MAYDPLNNPEDLAFAGESLAEDLDITTDTGFETVLEVARDAGSWAWFIVIMAVALVPFAVQTPAETVLPPTANCLMSPYVSPISEQAPVLCLETRRIPSSDEVQAYYRNRRVAAAQPGPWTPELSGKIRLAMNYWPVERIATPLDGTGWQGLSAASTVVAHQRAFPMDWQTGREATDAEMNAKVLPYAQHLVEALSLEGLTPSVYEWARSDLGLLSVSQANLLAAEVGQLHTQVADYEAEIAPIRTAMLAQQLRRTRLAWLRFGSVLVWVVGFVWLCRARVVTVRREGDTLYVDGVALSLETGMAQADGEVVRLIADKQVLWELRPDLWDAERCAALAYLINQPVRP